LLPELTPNLGSARANWYRNASVLRRKIAEGYEIRDASKFRKLSDPDPTPSWPERQLKQSFLGTERNVMKNKGFKLNMETGVYEYE
jgi:hypothetical protein